MIAVARSTKIERHLCIGEDESNRDVAPIVERERREQNDEDSHR